MEKAKELERKSKELQAEKDALQAALDVELDQALERWRAKLIKRKFDARSACIYLLAIEPRSWPPSGLHGGRTALRMYPYRAGQGPDATGLAYPWSMAHYRNSCAGECFEVMGTDIEDLLPVDSDVPALRRADVKYKIYRKGNVALLEAMVKDLKQLVQHADEALRWQTDAIDVLSEPGWTLEEVRERLVDWRATDRHDRVVEHLEDLERQMMAPNAPNIVYKGRDTGKIGDDSMSDNANRTLADKIRETIGKMAPFLGRYSNAPTGAIAPSFERKRRAEEQEVVID
jgi:hypothetical protein